MVYDRLNLIRLLCDYQKDYKYLNSIWEDTDNDEDIEIGLLIRHVYKIIVDIKSMLSLLSRA